MVGLLEGLGQNEFGAAEINRKLLEFLAAASDLKSKV
jgi:hypothetical protein